MGEKLVIGPINKGFRNDVTPFVIDNDSFPTLINAYQWRSRLKRKRGTQFLTRLQRFVNSAAAPYTISNTTITLANDGAGNGVGNIFSFFGLKGDITNVTQAVVGQVTSPNHNLSNNAIVLITGVNGMVQLNGNTYTITVVDPNNFTIGIDTTGFGAYTSGGLWQNTAQLSSSLVPGSITIVDTTTGNTYTDDSKGNLIGVPAGTGTVNYATGDILITGGAGDVINAKYNYYPTLPVMGLRDFSVKNAEFPGTLGFDTTYSYNILTTFPYSTYDVTYYKNPPASASLPGYVQKTTPTPFTWHGQDYQQFWTINYQNALWATNGIPQPFDPAKISMQFTTITGIAIVPPVPPAPPPSIVTITVANNGLVVGDWVFLNEIQGMTGINYQTGYVIAINAGLNQITVELPQATVAGVWTSGGIVQYLTNNSNNLDCIKWYDGDPTNGNATNPTLNGNLGWVNFSPPLSNNIYSIADAPAQQYYLAGARLLYNFKDRLIAFGPVIQTSSPNSQIYLQDTIIFSENGTPYYTMSFSQTATQNYPLFPTAAAQSLLVPVNQTAFPAAWFEDVSGYGGFLSAGVQQQIITLGPHQDVLIIGFTRLETQLVYTGNDDLPFNFYRINTELGVESTFSSVVMDKGVLSQGSRGFLITNQVESRRIDLEIPDEIFEVNRQGNGPERATAHRDYINEWIYFSYRGNEFTGKFPTQTLQFNYRDDSWAVFYETYTTYGLFRKQTGYTWATLPYPTWADWTDSWASGQSNVLQPNVIGGNQHGFVLIRGIGTDEGTSLAIQAISGSVLTVNDHCLNVNDYIIISGCLGNCQILNAKTYQIIATTQNTITIAPSLPSGLVYIGGGLITRLYVPYIQSRQFPFSWSMGRKTRIGTQQYLLTTTNNSQITLMMFLSQDDSTLWNYLNFPFTNYIVPDPNSGNNSLLYSAILYTCPESTNLGLTPANTNLQMPTALTQSQIWHRVNTSLIGDTVQVGFSISNDQMADYVNVGDPLTITGINNANPCVVTVNNTIGPGNLVQITGVVGTTELNFQQVQYNYYLVTSSNATSITLNVDSSAFGLYVSGGQVQQVTNYNQTAEIEIHGFIIDLTPSQLLA